MTQQTAGLEPLSPEEADDLWNLEEGLIQGTDQFQDMGYWLGQIRDKRLYRGTHATFEEYCLKRWEDLSPERACEYIKLTQTYLSLRALEGKNA